MAGQTPILIGFHCQLSGVKIERKIEEKGRGETETTPKFGDVRKRGEEVGRLSAAMTVNNRQFFLDTASIRGFASSTSQTVGVASDTKAGNNSLSHAHLTRRSGASSESSARSSCYVRTFIRSVIDSRARTSHIPNTHCSSETPRTSRKVSGPVSGCPSIPTSRPTLAMVSSNSDGVYMH